MDTKTIHEALVKGERVTGSKSVVEYAIGLALASLDKLYDHDAIATVVEIGRDQAGYFVTFILNDATEDVKM